VNGKDLLRFNQKDTVFNDSLEKYIKNLIKTEVLSPLPIYYNIEDQARLAKPDFQLTNFELYINNNPSFTLNDFRDTKTTFLSLEIHDDNLFQNKTAITNYINPLHDSECDYIVSIIKDAIVNGFLDCFNEVIKSIFSAVDVIIDIESGLFSVHSGTLKLKYSYDITKEEISKEYAYLVKAIENPIENILESFSIEYLGIYLQRIDKLPTRITFNISPTINRIRLSSPELDKVYAPNLDIVRMSEYSSSDTDESNLAKEYGESMYLSDYRYDDPSGL
jgi:hypothetical protein